MNKNRIISTVVLALFLVISIPAFAQKGQEKKGNSGEKARQAQHQPQHMRQAKRQPHRVQHARRIAVNRGNNGHHYGRISDDHYRANFGHEHSFRMIHPQMISGHQRFQYGGYWFGLNQRWPSGWSYDDDVYVRYSSGAYYMYNLRHPGIHITLNLF